MPETIIAAYSEQAIWGVGVSAEAAVEDAVNYVSRHDMDAFRAGLKTAPMNDGLAKHVACAGGNCAFGLGDDGVLFLDTDD